MTRFIAEVGTNQLACELDADDATTEDQHVNGVVLEALVSRIAVLTKSGAYARNSVRGHRCAKNAATQHDAALDSVLAQRASDRLCIVGIMSRVAAVSTEVEDFAMLFSQEAFTASSAKPA
jgi:hypothetical protein